MERQYDIHITTHAEQAMREIASYIAVDLQVPETAMQMLRTFQVEIAKLKMMPQSSEWRNTWRALVPARPSTP